MLVVANHIGRGGRHPQAVVDRQITVRNVEGHRVVRIVVGELALQVHHIMTHCGLRHHGIRRVRQMIEGIGVRHMVRSGVSHVRTSVLEGERAVIAVHRLARTGEVVLCRMTGDGHRQRIRIHRQQTRHHRHFVVADVLRVRRDGRAIHRGDDIGLRAEVRDHAGVRHRDVEHVRIAGLECRSREERLAHLVAVIHLGAVVRRQDHFHRVDDHREVVNQTIVGRIVGSGELLGRHHAGDVAVVGRISIRAHMAAVVRGNRATRRHRTGRDGSTVLQTADRPAVGFTVDSAVRTGHHKDGAVVRHGGVERDVQVTLGDHLLEVITYIVVANSIAGGERCRDELLCTCTGRCRARVGVSSHILRAAHHRTAQRRTVLQTRNGVAVVLAITGTRQRAHELQTIIHLRGV